MTTTVVALADVGEGIADAVVLEWKVAPGDPVHTNQTLLEIETVKAIVEVPAPCDGIVLALEAEEGDTVEVGAVLLTIAAESRSDLPASGSGSDLPASGSGSDLPASGSGSDLPASGSGSDLPASGSPSDSPAFDSLSYPPAQPGPLAKPNVRRYARELGIDLGDVTGTGPQGQITEQDLTEYHARHNGLAAPNTSRGETVAVEQSDASSAVAVSAVRRATADAVSGSFFSAPHATVFLEADATATVDFNSA
ncbi:biotin/lipoyl-containing protein [Nocardia sp. R7R-8]|uniref:biotin/lipoyl-containing protein n=1 Tax=Nocardia sp. R7R-8 TaxID=3459304 RepID=UPI00403DE5D1